MQYCKICVMPDTRPGIKFKDGICCPCLNFQRRKSINWKARWKELEKLVTKYRGSKGNDYDCIVTVSSGKDSHYQVYTIKERLKMNPLLLSIDNWSWTKTGIKNKENIQERFGCDMLTLTLNRRAAKKMLKKGLEHNLIPTWYWDRAVYSYPLQMAIKFQIPLIIYGENINYEYGGGQAKETSSALDQINNNVAKPTPWKVWLDKNISMKDLNPLICPAEKEIKKAKLNPIYLSYFEPWDGYQNYKLAKKLGFRSLEKEWIREGLAENYEQIDTVGYSVHSWLKFPKFGHQHNTDILAQWIRSGRISRKKAVELVKKNEHVLDKRMLKDFVEFIGITEKKFWSIVDKFANKNILEKQHGQWRLKPAVITALEKGRKVRQVSS